MAKGARRPAEAPNPKAFANVTDPDGRFPHARIGEGPALASTCLVGKPQARGGQGDDTYPVAFHDEASIRHGAV